VISAKRYKKQKNKKPIYRLFSNLENKLQPKNQKSELKPFASFYTILSSKIKNKLNSNANIRQK
jgi:hypothetical protein